MKTKDKKTEAKENAAADHTPSGLPEGVVLQKCTKALCEATYNRASLIACPKCGEPRPDLATAEEKKGLQAQLDAEPPIPAAPVVPEFPFIAQPAVAGGVIIRVDGGKVFRPMTQDDVNAAAEEIGTISEQHEKVSNFLHAAELEVSELEQNLKDQRGIVRTTEGKRKTTDSPNHKPDPGEQLIRVSVSASAYNRLTPPRKDGMRKVAGRDDEPVYPLNWSGSDDAERLYVDIPRRLLGTVSIMAGPTLDFKQDTGAVVVEID